MKVKYYLKVTSVLKNCYQMCKACLFILYRRLIFLLFSLKNDTNVKLEIIYFLWMQINVMHSKNLTNYPNYNNIT